MPSVSRPWLVRWGRQDGYNRNINYLLQTLYRNQRPSDLHSMGPARRDQRAYGVKTMRFEETLNNSVANFPEFGVRYSRLTVPYVTHEEIEDGIARGRRLRAQFYRQAAEAVVVRQILFGARFTARITGTVIETLNRDRELRGTIKALRSLEDWQLSDIGVDRSDIRTSPGHSPMRSRRKSRP